MRILGLSVCRSDYRNASVSVERSGRAGTEKRFLYFHGSCIRCILALLLALGVSSITITPGFGWYLFCGFCLALSVIAPGMSFSTLLMPLGLYTPFVDGIGSIDMNILIPEESVLLQQ